MRIIVAVIAISFGCLGCGGIAPISPSSVAVPASDGAAPPAATPASSASTVAWGPLAVVPPQDGADTARTEGTLHITDDCAFLDTAGGPVVLVWPADRTAWNAEAQTITFTNFDGSTVSVGDGASVVLGGSGDGATESGTTVEAWLARTPWVARPAPSCPLDSWWSVGALETTASSAAMATIDRYVAALVNGDYPTAWAMLAPESRAGWGSVAAFAAERAPYFRSVAGRYTVAEAPPATAPLSFWITEDHLARVDPSHATLIEVDYPALAGNNAGYELYIVTDAAAGSEIFSVR
jgi:hypothetical protein